MSSTRPPVLTGPMLRSWSLAATCRSTETSGALPAAIDNAKHTAAGSARLMTWSFPQIPPIYGKLLRAFLHMGPNPYVAILWVVGFVLIVVLVMSKRGRPGRRPGSGATGAVWDLLNEDKRRAIEIIVEQRAEARDAEDAEGNKPDLDDPVERTAFARL